jgi:hypothetical protein
MHAIGTHLAAPCSVNIWHDLAPSGQMLGYDDARFNLCSGQCVAGTESRLLQRQIAPAETAAEDNGNIDRQPPECLLTPMCMNPESVAA